MQNNFMKKILIGTTAVALTLAWAVVPRSHAAAPEPQEECDLSPAPSVAVAEAQPSPQTPPVQAAAAPESPEECAPTVAVAATQPSPQAAPSVQSEEAQKTSPETAKVSATTSDDKKVVVSKRRREMDDNEMDGLNAGITGSFDITGNGNQVMTDNSVQSINLSDQAQQNLSSLVNILSINSTISVMLNLNVNINSTVGTVNQGNTGTQTGPP